MLSVKELKIKFYLPFLTYCQLMATVNFYHEIATATFNRQLKCQPTQTEPALV